MTRLAIFDIDGTIFRSSLAIELLDALIQEGIFPREATNQYERFYTNWLDRKGTYEDYIDAVVKAFHQHIQGVRGDVFMDVCWKVAAFHRNRVYRYTRDLLLRLKEKRYYLLAITGSPKFVAQPFCKYLGFNKVYGTMFEVNGKGVFTGNILHLDLIHDKARVLQHAVEKEKLTLKGSVGVGDTESDIPFLKMVDKPICFNPNQKLYRYAKRKKWDIVVERKDMIYHL